jgi:hypothetical protein
MILLRVWHPTAQACAAGTPQDVPPWPVAGWFLLPRFRGNSQLVFTAPHRDGVDAHLIAAIAADRDDDASLVSEGANDHSGVDRQRHQGIHPG